MRRKEVEKSIKSLEKFVNQKYYNGVTAEEMKTVLNYISELEKGIKRLKKKNDELHSEVIDAKVDKVTKNFIHKNKIRDKIKELEEERKEIESSPYDKWDLYKVIGKIEVLKEIIGEQ